MSSMPFFLRSLYKKDAIRMLEWMHNEQTMKYLQFDGAQKTLDDVYEFIEIAQKRDGVNLHLAITSKDDKYYGTVSLKNIDKVKSEAEYAISLHPQARGKGAAKQASKEILRIAFQDLSLHRVYLNVIRDNQRAVQLYEKMGFRYLYSDMITFKGKKNTELCWYEIKQ